MIIALTFDNSGEDIEGIEITGITLLPPSCPCEAFEQTGKMCVHLKAVSLYHVNGPIEDWQGKDSTHTPVNLGSA